MKISRILATGVAASLLPFGTPLIADEEGELLFQDVLNTDTSANWTILTNAPAEAGEDDWVATFAWDYNVTHGIPVAPNAVDGITKGLRLQVNRFLGTPYALTLLPNGQNFTGNYVMKFDLWINFGGQLHMPAGVFGSTEYAVFGVGTDGETVHSWAPSPATGVGGWFAMHGDGGNSFTYRAFANPISLAAIEGGPYPAFLDPDFDTEQDARRWSQPYYHTAVPGGAGAPLKQSEWSNWETWGTTDPGVPGFMWHEVAIEVIGDTVRWYLNDLLIAELTPENSAEAGVVPTEGNVFLGYADHASSVIDGPIEDHNFGLFSNVRVYRLPSDATGFAGWAEEGIADENARGPMDNPSGDGINNLLKYALGLDPAVADVGGLPEGVAQEDGGETYLTLTASKNPDATDVTLVVEVSGDLESWTSGEGQTTVLLDDANTLQVRDNTPLSGAGRRFIRLNASIPE